jgi:hypothetical protein
MNEAKHTPGLWSVQDGTAAKGHRNIVTATEYVATAYGDHIDATECDANARLIAAAPLMLAALQALSDALPSDEYMRAQGQEPGPGLVAMREAIAAATVAA